MTMRHAQEMRSRSQLIGHNHFPGKPARPEKSFWSPVNRNGQNAQVRRAVRWHVMSTQPNGNSDPVKLIFQRRIVLIRLQMAV